jgi:predicted RNA-binding Zn ribbon-like protein
MEDELRRWLDDRGLAAGDSDLERLRDVREPLRALLIANNEGSEPPQDAVATLDAAAAESPLAVRFGGAGAELAPRDALGAVLGAAYAGMAAGMWPRLKACRNCHWAFYDTSKNRSGTWCSMQLCGNRLKTKRFRKRHG